MTMMARICFPFFPKGSLGGDAYDVGMLRVLARDPRISRRGTVFPCPGRPVYLLGYSAKGTAHRRDRTTGAYRSAGASCVPHFRDRRSAHPDQNRVGERSLHGGSQRASGHPVKIARWSPQLGASAGFPTDGTQVTHWRSPCVTSKRADSASRAADAGDDGKPLTSPWRAEWLSTNTRT